MEHWLLNMVIGGAATAIVGFFAAKKGWLVGLLNAGVDKANNYVTSRWGIAIPERVHDWQHSIIETAVAWMEGWAMSKQWWRTLGWDIYKKNPARLVELKERIESIDPKDFGEGLLPDDIKAVVNEYKLIGVQKVVAAKVMAYSPEATVEQKIAATATATKVNMPLNPTATPVTATKAEVLDVFKQLIAASERRQEELIRSRTPK